MMVLKTQRKRKRAAGSRDETPPPVAKQKECRITRRHFIKGSSALGAGVLLWGPGGLNKRVNAAQAGEDTERVSAGCQYFYQACPRNCHDTCTLVSQVVDGRIVKITGDPTHPITAGTPCVKGQTYLDVVYHPDRLLHPMKRAGQKGEGKWERVSWDEAYDMIADQFQKIIDQDGAEAILPYSYSGNLGLINNYGVPFMFWNKLGASNLNRAICEPAGAEALKYTYGTCNSLDPEELANTQLIIDWGGNLPATGVHQVKFINRARAKGAKLIVVNPVRTPLASQADLHLSPFPGTDVALALGMANVMIAEGLYDRDFVENYTLGLEELKAKAAQYPLDRVEKITGVPAEAIREFVRLYTQIKPSILKIGYGITRNTNGGSMVRAISFLPALAGTVGMENGGFLFINTGHWAVDWNPLKRPDLLGDRKVRTINMNEIGKALAGKLAETAQKPIKALFVYNANPMASSPNTNLIKTGLLREDLFTVVADPFMTDTADYADLVLPAATFFEYEDLNSDYLGYYLRLNTPAIQPLGEAKSNLDIFFGLAQRMGYTEDCFKATAAELIKAALNSGNPIYEGVTYELLQEKHWVKLKVPVAFADHQFKTPSGKIEFSAEGMKKIGLDPVVEHIPPAESRAASPELYQNYPIHLLSPSIPQLLNSQFHNIVNIQEAIEVPFILMNKEDAGQRGLKTGDFARVENERGSVLLQVRITEAARPGVAVTGKDYWHKLVPGSSAVNALTLDELGDMAGQSSFHTNLVQVVKATEREG